MGEILLRAENIDKHFGITHALDNVSFTFNKGEIHALIGENGSGKSTLTSCLTGIYQKDSGKFILEGKEITATNQVEANHQGVAIIVQEIGTLSGLTVAENIFLGNEDQFTKCGIKNTAAMNKKAQEYLDSYGFNYIDATKVIDDYNFEDRKLVEIVKSTYFNPKVLVVDETTTALGQKGREELFKVMHKVRDTGNCVIFISHDLEEVIEQSDNISVLRDGVKIGSITKEEATPCEITRMFIEHGRKDLVKFFSVLKLFWGNTYSFYVVILCSLQRISLRIIADNQRNFCICNLSTVNGIQDSLQIRAAS